MTSLEYKADTSTLEAVVARALEIEAVLKTDYLEVGQAEFIAALRFAQQILQKPEPTQQEIADAADALNLAMANLRKIPDKTALESLVKELSAISGDGYTAESFAALRAALNIAQQVLANPEATQEEVDSALSTCKDAKEKLNKVHNSSSGHHSSNSGNSSSSGNISGNGTAVAVPSTIVAAAQGVSAQQAYVRSDTTVNFTLKHGQAYCFKMTVVNGNNQTPSFTVGNGSVLKTQFVAKVGNDYYYRVYATGAPGQSTGVYTTLPGQNAVKHCTVTIG